MNFYPCNQLGDPSPSTVGFLPFPPKKMDVKGQKVPGGWRRGWLWFLPAGRGLWRRRACGRRGWGTRTELCSSYLHRDRASPAGSPPLQPAERSDLAKTPPSISPFPSGTPKLVIWGAESSSPTPKYHHMWTWGTSHPFSPNHRVVPGQATASSSGKNSPKPK